MNTYKIGWLRYPMIVTEIKRPDGCLVLESEGECELTQGEYDYLSGANNTGDAIVPPGLLTLQEPVEIAEDAQEAVDEPKAEQPAVDEQEDAPKAPAAKAKRQGKAKKTN